MKGSGRSALLRAEAPIQTSMNLPPSFKETSKCSKCVSHTMSIASASYHPDPISKCNLNHNHEECTAKRPRQASWLFIGIACIGPPKLNVRMAKRRVTFVPRQRWLGTNGAKSFAFHYFTIDSTDT
ncbi:hypothetical protein M413DRAFT_383687 [Hebeloma cylindrosporum]|uniref:Uncharacterized protein n=1 Tax=Hebeloma cylindrosporum TaxID=76867 RepID=A0A0C3C3V3_HEBCY|nr:hypothetical protein M413DRAFT_383687 [Hebeloma cylindrosporum h7]